MRIRLVALAVLFSFTLIFGCISGGNGGTPTPTPEASPELNATPEDREPFAAMEGLEEAKAGVSWLRPDAELVGVQGSCDVGGKSSQWQYSFDSPAAGIGYVLSVPGGAASMRDVAFSFSQPLGAQWVDSTQAASTCGISAGDFSLEVADGTPIWTVISGSTVCEVNATSGQRLAGD